MTTPVWVTVVVAVGAAVVTAVASIIVAAMKSRTETPAAWAAAFDLVTKTVSADYARLATEMGELRAAFANLQLEFKLEQKWSEMKSAHIEAGNPPPPPERPTEL